MQLPYDLSRDAEKDLREVARYTLNKWGNKKLEQYRNGLKNTFETIANNKIQRRNLFKTFPDLFVTKYKYHFIFYISQHRKKPVIIGVIHERRDIVSRLKERLT